MPRREAFSQRISSTLEPYPYLAPEDDGVIVGYAYAHRAGERAAYQWNAELSVYLALSHTGRGIGKQLYGTLMDLLHLQGVKTVYGVVTSPDPASEALRQSPGFRLIGAHRNTGYKNGGWIDVNRFEKPLSPCDPEPEPVTPIGQLPPGRVRESLSSCRKSRFVGEML